MKVRDWFLQMADNNNFYPIPRKLDAEHTRIDFLLSDIIDSCTTQKEIDLIITISLFKEAYELLHYYIPITTNKLTEKEIKIIQTCYRSLQRLNLLDKLQLEKIPEKTHNILKEIEL